MARARRLPGRGAAARLGEDRPRRRDRGRRLQPGRRATTRSRTAARTTTGRSARATSTPRTGVAICPRHGANIDIRTGRAADAAGGRARSRRFPSASRTGSSRSRSRELSRRAAGRATDPAYNRVPRRGVGPAGARTSAGCYERLLPRGLPVRALLADDPAQARELPRGVRRLRPRARRAVRRARRRAAARATPASCGTAARSRRRSPTRARQSRCAKPGRRCAELVWSHRRDGPPPESRGTGSRRRPASAALSKELRKAGFRFVGPTTVYAAMQACGIVNDHLRDLPRARRSRSEDATLGR